MEAFASADGGSGVTIPGREGGAPPAANIAALRTGSVAGGGGAAASVSRRRAGGGACGGELVLFSFPDFVPQEIADLGVESGGDTGPRGEAADEPCAADRRSIFASGGMWR